MLTRHSSAALAAGLMLMPVFAQPASRCPVSGQTCFQWGAAPAAAAAAAAGSNSVYFQIRAPTSYQWVGLGIGSQMAGADMFVVYADGRGNVTLSTRQGRGHVAPTYAAKQGVELLEGSGVLDGTMVANVRCRNCSGLGAGGSSQWLSAWKDGRSLDSASPSAQIAYHDGHEQFSVDLAAAALPSDANPFVSGGGGIAGTGGSASRPGAVVVANGNPNEALLHAHGVIMTLVFLLGFPVGSLLMPWLGSWILHMSWQLVVFALMWAGFGTGYVLASRTGLFFKQAHTRLGIILCCLVGLQPVLGWLHHRHYVAHQRRGAVSHAHVWYGRAIIVLGVVNGALGLRLAGSRMPFVVAYYTVLGAVAALYLATVAFRALGGRRGGAPQSPSATGSSTKGVK
ncbi:uncharacterized protein UV8b_05263 [Ustilaginoidea virens]|uniref:DOMON domain-containing protein n=1 Tax=Ustilaginoidea virens TaxID=1159556 RepID=A0A1B5KUL7_USTVR|nr:uncharacterized protein UV8b_05263 [Ustilaginoidea virens]QUC21022.1 hypothetical protein UV8b_05263 [Ustilaginoidea virens]GAO14667.1 hypothetical protein UVI_02008850 [Ustilaginoidea virens]